MQRARAFKIFEVAVALSKNKRSADAARDTLTSLQVAISKLELELERSSLNDKKDSQISAGHAPTRRHLLEAREIVKKRIEDSEFEFPGQVNRMDAEEIRVIDAKLLEIACRGISSDEYLVSPAVLCERIEALLRESKKLTTKLKRLQCENKKLELMFEKAYEIEEDKEEEEGEGEVGDNNEEEDLDRLDEGDGDANKRGGTRTPTSPARSVDNNPSPHASRGQQLSTVPCDAVPSVPRRRSRFKVPPVAPEEASRFFLIAHMLSHLGNAEGYDVHGKTFYDLTGSGGQVILLKIRFKLQNMFFFLGGSVHCRIDHI
jgi:hypothetical protein